MAASRPARLEEGRARRTGNTKKSKELEKKKDFIAPEVSSEEFSFTSELSELYNPN